MATSVSDTAMVFPRLIYRRAARSFSPIQESFVAHLPRQHLNNSLGGGESLSRSLTAPVRCIEFDHYRPSESRIAINVHVMHQL